MHISTRPVFLLPIVCIHLINAARILFVPAHSAPSHAKGMYPLAEALSLNGHEVTVLQFAKFEVLKARASPKSAVRDHYLMIPRKQGDDVFHIPAHILWGHLPLGGPTMLLPWTEFTRVCKGALENEKLKQEFYALIRESKFDLVIVDNIFAPCGMLAAAEAKKVSNASVINFGTTILMPHSQEVRGLPINKALYPSVLKPIFGSHDHSSFKHRLHNFLDHVSLDLVETLLDHLIPYRLDMSGSQSVSPSPFALHSDLLVASLSPMLEFAKPRSNDVIELDVDCPPKAQLPENYQKFVDDPKSKGTIVFAMGHAADWDEVPPGVLESFLEAFTKLADYRIVWQYATKKPKPVTPSNLIMDAWIPQPALLYHPKTKLFISHVGGKSLREAICASVPMVTMPMFAEQYRNAAIANKKKIATFLDKAALSPHVVYQAITKVLNDSSYRNNVQALKEQLEDQIVKPVELGRFWMEFLLRHKSSSVQKYFHMKSPHLSYVAAQSRDWIAVSLLVMLGWIKIVF